MEKKTMAISAESFELYGCPHCGYRSGFSLVSYSGSTSCRCGECDGNFILLAEGVEKSAISVGNPATFLELTKHPREGIPAHGRPDTRPEGGGEFFQSRGIGLDITPGCFVCGGKEALYTNISGFVRTKEAGERVVKMFNGVGAYLDFREHEPDRVQVKIGACDKHLGNLKLLEGIIKDKFVIMDEMIIFAKRKK